jgi:hypothetical protein
VVYLTWALMLREGTVVGRYRVEGLLGRGGMAIVYRARHVELGRRVALKLLAVELSSDPEFVARFRREGQLQASLEHPHVVTVYEAGESEHGLFLAMRLVSGSTLAELIREREVGVARALILLRQAADALDAAHAAGLVHRDVKPQNVLVGDSDDAYVGDFGLTRVGGSEGVTATGKLLGTISYLAPEVIRGSEATPASDRYSFAAMAFESLTGTVVYPRRTEAAVLYAHTSEPPPRISRRREELPEALDEVFVQALAKHPEARPDSAGALVDAISDVLNAASAGSLGPPPPPGVAALEGTTVEPIPSLGPPAGRVPVRRRIALWLAGAALLGAAAALGIAALADHGNGSAAAAAPDPRPGAVALGSDLAEAGRALDCRARSPRPGSPSCTVLQSELPGETLVVPEDGVIRRWAVRSALGELRLSVIRPRGEPFQVARSRDEFIGDDSVHVFDANLGVERGDLVGVVVIPGSAVGVRAGVDGAVARRWTPSLAEGEPVDLHDQELLFWAEYYPGGQKRLPHQVSGAAAEDLRRGQVIESRRVHFTDGRPVEIALVRLGHHFVLDQFMNGRRTARIGVPDFRPPGRVIKLGVFVDESAPANLNVNVQFANQESERILQHYYEAGPGEFELVN